MRNNNKPTRRSIIGAAFLGMLLSTSISTKASETHDNYAFMSAQDLYDALSQKSQVALGYLLGIVDTRKGPQADGSCFTIPWQSDADAVIVKAYLEYWPSVADFSLRAPDALIQMMLERFPCNKNDAAQ